MLGREGGGRIGPRVLIVGSGAPRGVKRRVRVPRLGVDALRETRVDLRGAQHRHSSGRHCVVVARVPKVSAERLDDVEDALGVPSGLQVGEVRELRVELGAIPRCDSGKARRAGRISLLVWMRNFVWASNDRGVTK